MNIKSILCIFSGSERELNALNTALLIGKAHGARIRILHISPEPRAYAGIAGEGMIATAEIIAAIEKENNERFVKAKQFAVSFAAKHHIPLDSDVSPTRHASAQFIHATGYLDSVIAEEGRLSDVIVIGRGTIESEAAVMTSLFNTGRPVMLLPPVKDFHTPEYKTIAVAWKGTKEASRAMVNAMPFLEKAEKVYILTAEGFGETYDLNAEAAILDYFNAHGLSAKGIIVAAGNRPMGEALLTRAKELHCDLLVMGAYGHSRVREMILGGVTRHMLEKADMPLLLSH